MKKVIRMQKSVRSFGQKTRKKGKIIIQKACVLNQRIYMLYSVLLCGIMWRKIYIKAQNQNKFN